MFKIMYRISYRDNDPDPRVERTHILTAYTEEQAKVTIEKIKSLGFYVVGVK